jgi:2,3-diketo-5-methylthiopentyl-1-phosphate enolase
MSDAILATYRFLSGSGRDIRGEAAAFATGQSVGTWLPLPGLTPVLVARHGASLVEVSEPHTVDDIPADLQPARLPVLPPRSAGEQTFVDVTIAFPAENVEGGFPMLWTTLLGNDPSTGITAMLIDLEIPGPLAAQFGGPRLGIDGWRRRFGFGKRPLLLNPMKPSIGLAPDATGALAAAVARGGIDLVKDDEVLSETRFSSVRDRTRAVRDALDATAERSGHRARYIVSITDRADRMAEHVETAVEAGADGVMVAALAIGLDGLQAVAERLDGRLPVMAHTAGLDVWSGRHGLGVAPDLVVRLCRLAGADAVLIGSPWARRPTLAEVWRAMAARLHEPWAGLACAFPVVGGGVVADQLGDIVRSLGSDLIITAGGSVNGHPDGSEAGARDLRRALEKTLSVVGGIEAAAAELHQ